MASVVPPPLPAKSSPSVAPPPLPAHSASLRSVALVNRNQTTGPGSELANVKRLLAERIAELNRLRHEHSELSTRLSERDTRVRALEGEVQQARSEASSTASVPIARRLEQVLQQQRDATASLVERDRKLMHLEARCRELESQHREMPEDNMGRFAALERALAARERKIRELENELSLAHGWGAQSEDDLTRIKGIGPKLSQRLKDNGVVTFAAIAAWSAEDIDEQAALLKVPASRIRRDDWIQSAKSLIKP